MAPRGAYLQDAKDVVLVGPDESEVGAAFEAGGPLARAGFEARPGQRRMAEAVARAFSGRSHLVVEAGTGTGKSAAYLVPALKFAVANNVRVVISTYTTALQDQLVDREIGRVASALGLEASAVTLKGYDRYLCLRRFSRLWVGIGLARPALGVAAMLTTWIADTAFDELDSLNLHTLGALDGLVRASQAGCLKDRCRFGRDGSCFMWGRRRAANAAHLLVVNHALLLANSRFGGGLYPPGRHVVIDEAHQLEEVARQALSLRLSRHRATSVLGDLAARGRSLVPARALASASARAETDARATAVSAAAAKALPVLESFFSAVVDLVGDRAGGTHDTRTLLLSRARWDQGLGAVLPLGEDALDALSGVIHALQLLELQAEEHRADIADEDLALAEAAADLRGWRAELQESAEALSRALDPPSTEAGLPDVAAPAVWFELERRGGRHDESVRVAPLDVGEALAETVFDAHSSVVLTSATLSAGDDFAHCVRTVGLDRSDRPPALLKTPSPFDHERQTRVFVVTDLPEPGADGYLAALADLLADLHRGTRGGALTLFTRRSDMEAVHRTVSAELAADGLPVLCQGSGGKRRLTEEFRADPQASLMATRSFWQGFDAPGDTLRMVVIARLPFGYWGDPLAEALRERDPARFWPDHYLPRAVVDLKQAVGRLIRSPEDRGVVVLADSRIERRRYGDRFIAALPTGTAVFDSGDAVARAAAEFLDPFLREQGVA